MRRHKWRLCHSLPATPKAAPTPMAPPPPASMKVVDVVGKLEGLAAKHAEKLTIAHLCPPHALREEHDGARNDLDGRDRCLPHVMLIQENLAVQ